MKSPPYYSLMPITKIEKESNLLLKSKYKSDVHSFNMKIVNDIVYNERTRMVAVFKDFLILDDYSEFFRRFYPTSESLIRLDKIIDFYETYSRIFPNYIIIPESKYLYRNIRKKQKMIDACNQIKKEDEFNKRKNELNNQLAKKRNEDQFFDSEIKNSISKYQPSYTNLNLESSLTSFKSQSLFSTSYMKMGQNILDILDNEESMLSVENILNVMDKKKLQNSIKNKQLKFENQNFNSYKDNDIKYKTKNIFSSENVLKYKFKNKDNVGLFLNINAGKSKGKIQETNKTNTKTETKLKGIHRVTSSVPEVIKIINNYPNIIIPIGSTHVNINQNYFNLGAMSPRSQMFNTGNIACQSPLGSQIIVENYNNLQNEKLNFYNLGSNIKINADRKINNLRKTSLTKSIIRKTKTLNNENIVTPKNKPKNFNFANQNQSTKFKTLSLKENNGSQVERTALSPKNNSLQSYGKILKIFQDNYNPPSSTKHNKFINTISKDKNQVKNSQTLKDETTARLNSPKSITHIESKESYKFFLEKNKFECLTVRNSLEKASQYLKTDNYMTSLQETETILNRINTTTSKSRLNSEKKSHQFIFSPTPFFTTLKSKEIVSNSKKNNNPFIISPIKQLSNSKINTITYQAKSTIKEKTVLNNPFEGISNGINRITLKSPKYAGTKINVRNEATVRSLDFNALKSYKK